MQVLLVDDHAPTRTEMGSLLAREEDLTVVGESESAEQAVEMARDLKPDVIVMDIVLPGMTGIEATEIIMREVPQTRIVTLSNHAGRNLVRAVISAGGMGYVLKDHAFEELVPAIRAAWAGKNYLGEDVNG